MNTITLTIAATPDNMRRLAEAFGECIDETLKADDIPAHRVPAHREEIGPEVRIQNADVPPAPVSENTENEVKPPETLAESVKNEDNRVITLSDLRSLGVKLTKEGKTQEIRALLDKYEAPKITELKEADYKAFYSELEAIA